MVHINVGDTTSPLASVLGVLGGLGQGFQAVRQEQDKRDLAALELLAKNPRMELSPLAASEAQSSPLLDRLLSGQRYQPTAEGFPVTSVGGFPLTVRRRPPLNLDALLGSTATPSVPTAPADSGTPAEPPITQGPLTTTPPRPGGTPPGAAAATPSPPPVAGTRALPTFPGQPSLDVTPAEIRQHPSVTAAVATYNADPSPANEAALRTAIGGAKKKILDERQQAFQDQLKEYNARVEQYKLTRQAGGVPDYGFGNDVNAAIHSLHGEELARTGQPPTADMVMAARQLAQRDRLAQASAQGQNSAQAQVAVKRLEALDKEAGIAQTSQRTLDEIERLIKEGIYGNSWAEMAQQWVYRLKLNPNDETAQRTKRVQELGAQLVAARGLGAQVSDKDAALYAAAAGNLQQGKNPGEMYESLKSMRTVLNNIITYTNKAQAHFAETGRLLPYEGGTFSLGEKPGGPKPQPGARGAPKVTTGTPTLPEGFTDADVDATLADLQKAGKQYTRKQVIEYLQKLKPAPQGAP